MITLIPQPKKSKYKNEKVNIDGLVFDSKKEARHYQSLKFQRSAGLLFFDCQVSYPIVVNGIKIAVYIADFVVTYPDGSSEVHDVKGVKTQVYQLKKKLIFAVYGIKIKEIL